MEYRIFVVSTPVNEEQLDELARQGWRLITILPFQNKLYFYFVRELLN